MDKASIGAILRKRIKEQGFTQERFAEETGVGLSTLKKYMSGKNAYSYEVMGIFAEALDCSYDYLLGLSKSPKREYHEITEQLRLSEEAISTLVGYASGYDEEFECRRHIVSLDMLLKNSEVFNSICDYLVISKPVDTAYKNISSLIETFIQANPKLRQFGIENQYKVNFETQQLIELVSSLKDLKAKMTPEFLAQMNFSESQAKIDEKKQQLLQELLSQAKVTG